MTNRKIMEIFLIDAKKNEYFNTYECTPFRNPIKIAYLSVKMTEPTKDLS